MHEGQHRRHAETPLEAVGDVEDNQGPGYDQGENGVRDQLAADGRADLLLTQHLEVAAVRLERIHDLHALVFLQRHGAHHDVLRAAGIRSRARGALELDGAAAEVIFREAVAHLLNRHRLLELQIDDAAAREVDAEVQPARGEQDNTRDNHAEGKKEPDLAMTRNIEFIHYLPSFCAAGLPPAGSKSSFFQSI